jgi:diguanylate cyclase (GGDEF)-like protein
VAIRSFKPHVKVGLVTVVLVAAGLVVMVVALRWLGLVSDGVERATADLRPPIVALDEVETGLLSLQVSFDRTLFEDDPTQRVLLLEETRQQLSVNESRWRAFRSASLGLPGEDDLVTDFEAAIDRQQALAGPIGLALVQQAAPVEDVDPQLIADLLASQTAARESIAELQTIYEGALDDSLERAGDDAEQGDRMVVAAFAVAMLLAVGLAVGAYRSARDTDRRQRAEGIERSRVARRNELEARLYRALEMAGSEPFAFDVVSQALRDEVPEAQSEVLLADRPAAPFVQVLASQPDHAPGCQVPSPGECPAARRGDRLVFSSSDALDACPYLRMRPGPVVAAVCQPVGIAGRSLGVVHSTFDGEPEPEAVARLELIARRLGDRTAMLRAFAETESQARLDPLTGLLNRRSLESAVGSLAVAGRRYCVAYGDLDHFKALNDTFGHELGDRALAAFAEVVAELVRPDDLAARYGGEEFVVVLPDCAVEEAVEVVNRVRTALAGALAAAGLPPFTVSWGVADSDQAHSFSRVVALADAALLRAKAEGRDRVLVAGPSALPPASSPAT